MKILKRLVCLCLGILSLFIGQSCTPKKAISLPNLLTSTVLIDSSFTAQSLNERVLVCTKLTEKELTRKDLKTWIAKNAVKVSQKKESIFLGSYRQYPEAWFYAQLINQDSLSRQLVVDENNRIRCDAFAVFTFKDGAFSNWGSINRSTPFSDYPIPFLTYAIPITINPKDTLNLLIHTERQYGRMEVNLGITSYQNYLGEHIFDFLSKIFQIIIYSICFTMMFILGGIFSYKAMTYLGYYLVSLLFAHLSAWGFIDAAMNFTGIGLAANNVAIFTVYIAIFSVHPFLMEWMKAVPKNERIFKSISYLLMGVSLFGICCFFVPFGLFSSIGAFFFLPQLMLILAFLSILWVFFCALYALFKAKIYYMLIGFGLAFSPFLLRQLNGFIARPSILLAQYSQSSYVFIPIGLSIISIYLLREQLVTRKKLKESLTQLNESMEDIRRNEVEEIGRNLHDNVGNILASSYLTLKKTNIATTEKLIKEAIQEIRFLSHNLVKDEDKPLAVKMEDLVARFNDFSAISFYFNDFSEGRVNQLEKLKQQNIYRIVQEILTNIIKHSMATEAHVQIFERDKNFQIDVEDDGIGMGNYQESQGIGLKNINKRAAIANLKLTIDSTSKGTSIIIDVKNEN